MKSKRKIGDRRDGKLLRNVDAMHFLMPLIYPNRCDNEAFISERIDLTNINKYLEKKNATNPEYKYNLFQVIVSAVLKTITLRPKMNIFIANKNMYQRNEVSAAFVIKKVFEDNSEEGMAFIHSKESDTIEDVHNDIYRQVNRCRKEKKQDSTVEVMELFNKLPRFISKAAVSFVCYLDKIGKVPKSFVSTDPYYSSVVISNLGSIKLKCGYHHLTNWGTTSVFLVIGEKKIRPFYDEDGNVTMKDSVDIGLTVDERIADGYYFSKTVKLLKKLLENPELLENAFGEEVDYE
ncbi:MAG: 2-oxo acid dehydrogenase subunit E2 [Clostridia bacterium]|nr:2-oxo acid dehydrogenase subunit E2 [Clostridia bacterium]